MHLTKKRQIWSKREKSQILKFYSQTYAALICVFLYGIFIEHLVCSKHHAKCQLSIALPMLLIYLKVKGLELLLPASVFFATDGQTCIILLIIYLGLELLGEAF